MIQVFTRTRVTKAIILGGGDGSHLSPLSKYGPLCALPVFNRPLIENTISQLLEAGITQVLVTTSGAGCSMLSGCIGDIRRRYRSAQIECRTQEKPRGTAGTLKDLGGFIGDEHFLLVSGNLFVEGLDLDAFLSEHYLKGSVLTVGVKREPRMGPDCLEGISVGEDGTVKEFSRIHASRERRSSLSPTGLYAIDPAVLEHISDKGYFDIKEQLIPALRKASMPVHAHEMEGYCRPIRSVEDYFALHRELLFRGSLRHGRLTEISEGVWAGEGYSIAPSAYITGPVILGKDCRIGENAQVIGPAVIGDYSVIGRGARLRESIAWSGLRMEDDSALSYSIAGNDTRVQAGDSIANRIIVDTLNPGELNLVPDRYEFKGVVETAAFGMGGFRYSVFLAVKRLIDLSVSSAMLLVLSPFMLFLAALVKLDSDGPVFFKQKRCGRDGKDFPMLKFRTMVKDAHALQKKLREQNKIDGPMFKIEGDPRITRLGRVLRATSLDELPQLFNVLKGEMSLVGPRPLVMDEMKFSPSWRSIRLKVKPGITGLWQIQGRSEAPFHDWIRHDIHYVRNQGLLFDLVILFKTLGVVFRKVGAY